MSVQPKQGSGDDYQIQQGNEEAIEIKGEKEAKKGSASYAKSVTVKDRSEYETQANKLVKERYIQEGRRELPEYGENHLNFFLQNPAIRKAFNEEVHLLADELEANGRAKLENVAKQKVPRSLGDSKIGQERVRKGEPKAHSTTRATKGNLQEVKEQGVDQKEPSFGKHKIGQERIRANVTTRSPLKDDLFSEELETEKEVFPKESETNDTAKEEKTTKRKEPQRSFERGMIGLERVRTSDRAIEKEKKRMGEAAIIETTTGKRELPISERPIVEEKSLDPHSAEGIANRLKEFSKSKDIENEENLRSLEDTFNEALREINKLGITNVKEEDLHKQELDVLKKAYELRVAVAGIRFIDSENGKIEEIKKKASELKGRIPDTAEAITVKEWETKIDPISQFYDSSAKLYKLMAKTKFAKDATFDVGQEKKQTFRDLLNFKKDIAKENVKKKIPEWKKNLNKAQPGHKGEHIASAATRGLTEGVGSESETLLKYAKAYLSNLPKPAPEGTDELLREIEDIRSQITQTKIETSQDTTPWALHEMGKKDLIDFQRRLTQFVASVNERK